MGNQPGVAQGVGQVPSLGDATLSRSAGVTPRSAPGIVIADITDGATLQLKDGSTAKVLCLVPDSNVVHVLRTKGSSILLQTVALDKLAEATTSVTVPAVVVPYRAKLQPSGNFMWEDLPVGAKGEIQPGEYRQIASNSTAQINLPKGIVLVLAKDSESSAGSINLILAFFPSDNKSAPRLLELVVPDENTEDRGDPRILKVYLQATENGAETEAQSHLQLVRSALTPK